MTLFKAYYKKSTIALLLLPFLCFSQAAYTEAELMEFNIKEVNITAREYVNGEVVKEVKLKDLVNEYGKSTEYTTYRPDGSIKKQIKSFYIDDGRTEIDTSFSDDGTVNFFLLEQRV